jgi:hypothetical protein
MVAHTCYSSYSEDGNRRIVEASHCKVSEKKKIRNKRAGDSLSGRVLN